LGKHWRGSPQDVDVALEYLRSQPSVNRDIIGLGGAGLLGVDNCVEAARRHPAEVKSLLLMSGETFHDGLQFLHQASQLSELFVFSERRIPSDARCNEVAVCDRIQPQQEARPLPSSRGCAMALV
jgi:hypothetical protein